MKKSSMCNVQCLMCHRALFCCLAWSLRDNNNKKRKQSRRGNKLITAARIPAIRLCDFTYIHINIITIYISIDN